MQYADGTSVLVQEDNLKSLAITVSEVVKKKKTI